MCGCLSANDKLMQGCTYVCVGGCSYGGRGVCVGEGLYGGRVWVWVSVSVYSKRGPHTPYINTTPSILCN